MKKFILLLLITFYAHADEGDDAWNLMRRIRTNFSKNIENLYGMQTSGTGEGGPVLISNVCIHFDSNREVNIEKARMLYVHLAEKLLANLNNCKQIREYLSNYPFKIQNIDFSIAFNTENAKNPSLVQYITAVNGNLLFYNCNYSTKTFIKLHSEPYEESIRIVKERK